MAYKTKRIMLDEKVNVHSVTNRLVDSSGLYRNSEYLDTQDKNKNKYNVIEYPKNQLGSARYPHYTMFYVNESEKTTIATTQGNSLFVVEDGLNSGTSIATVAAAGQTKEAVKKAVNAVGAYLEPQIDTIVNAVNKIESALVGEQNKASINKMISDTLSSIAGSMKEIAGTASKRVRVKDVMALPMPIQVRSNYQAGYSAIDPVSGLGAVILGALQKGNANVKETLGKAVIPGVAEGLSTVAKTLTAGIVDPNINKQQIADIQNKITGTLMNGRQEQIFRNMEFRHHQFQYLFIPRNAEESKSILDIIYKFKFYMHPELMVNTGSSLLHMPAEFNIKFMSKDKENNSLHKIETCALQSCEVDYTPIGEFIAFADTSDPVAISLTLTFVELEPLTRQKIQRAEKARLNA